MEIGDRVRILDGASDWMKERNYWLPDMGDSIDELEGEIVADYTTYSGDDCHYGLYIQEVGLVGVNPRWLTLVGARGDFVLVPRRDIEAIEKARLRLHEINKDCDTATLVKLLDVTEPMWRIAHTRYDSP